MALLQIAFDSFFLYATLRTLPRLYFVGYTHICGIIYDFNQDGEGHFKIRQGEHLRVENHSPLSSNTVQTPVWATGIFRWREGRREGLLPSVIPREGSPCNKLLGTPTALSLNSSTQAIRWRPEPLLLETRLQYICVSLVFSIEAFSYVSGVWSPSPPTRFLQPDIQYGRVLRFWSSFPVPGRSLRPLCRCTHPTPSLITWSSDYLNTVTANLSLDPAWKPPTITRMYVLSLEPAKGCKRWVRRKLSPYTSQTKWGSRMPRSGVTGPRCKPQFLNPNASTHHITLER